MTPTTSSSSRIGIVLRMELIKNSNMIQEKSGISAMESLIFFQTDLTARTADEIYVHNPSKRAGSTCQREE